LFWVEIKEELTCPMGHMAHISKANTSPAMIFIGPWVQCETVAPDLSCAAFMPNIDDHHKCCVGYIHYTISKKSPTCKKNKINLI
jgi:hypothetical protein